MHAASFWQGRIVWLEVADARGNTKRRPVVIITSDGDIPSAETLVGTFKRSIAQADYHEMVAESFRKLPRTMPEVAGTCVHSRFRPTSRRPEKTLLTTLNDRSIEHGAKLRATFGEGRFIEGKNRPDAFETYKRVIRSYEKKSKSRRHVGAAWARRLLRGGISGAKLPKPKLDDQFSLADPPNRDNATSLPANAKDAAAPAISAEVRRRLAASR